MVRAASFCSLPVGLVQDILCHLDIKEQGRAACVSKLCASAVAPLAPLAHFVTAGDAPAVRRLLQKPDGRLGLDMLSCEHGRTPLQTAVAHYNPEIFAALLEAGAATETRDIFGWTALIVAAERGRASMVEALLAAGAALEAEDKDGRRALHCAAYTGHTSTVEALVAAGAARRLRARMAGARYISLPRTAILQLLLRRSWQRLPRWRLRRWMAGARYISLPRTAILQLLLRRSWQRAQRWRLRHKMAVGLFIVLP